MQKERNYINAIVEFHDDKTQAEVIFKVGEVDLGDDIHVFDYLTSENDIETLKYSDFKIIEYWKEKRSRQKSIKFDANDFGDWIQNNGNNKLKL